MDNTVLSYGVVACLGLLVVLTLGITAWGIVKIILDLRKK